MVTKIRVTLIIRVAVCFWSLKTHVQPILAFFVEFSHCYLHMNRVLVSFVLKKSTPTRRSIFVSYIAKRIVLIPRTARH